MLSARRRSGGVVSRRKALTLCCTVFKSRSSACSGYEGFCPRRNRTQPLSPGEEGDAFALIRCRSSGFCDQYHTSSAPTFHGVSRHPYHPLLPYIGGYCRCPSTSRACEFTASVIVRHASTYF